MIKKWLDKIEGKELMWFSIFSVILLAVVSLVIESPVQIAEGMLKIIISRDSLITDYFELSSYGASFFNAAIVLGIAVVLIITQKLPFTGITMSALYINLGYAFWGKNPVNILPILFGTFLYAKLHGAGFKRYVYTALFGTCLAPVVTEMAYILPFSQVINLLLAILLGIFVGFVLPPLAMHTASMHLGYNLYNVGFAAGVLAFVIVSLLQAIGIESESVLIWKEGRDPVVVLGLYLFFLTAVLLGLLINKGKGSGLKNIMRHPGRAVADFVLMDGAGATLMNMGLVGMVCVTYILIIGGDFSGPVIGSIFTAFGFAGFGAHLRNFLPVLAGVYISTLFSQFQPTTPGIQLAACFSVGLAPIAGQFGKTAGVIAGILHSVIVMRTSDMYGGLNLYNNGFSAGWVAIVMVPCIESFMNHYENRKNAKRA